MKIIAKILAVLIVLILFFSQYGLEIGSFKIGTSNNSKSNLKTNSKFEESEFFKSYFAKDNLTVINLWATWCTPCIEEMPDLNILKQRYSNTEVQFISLSIDDDLEPLKKFIQSNKFKFSDITLNNIDYRNAILNTLENKEINASVRFKSVPKTYLFKNKKILKSYVGTVDGNTLAIDIEKYK